MRVCTRVPCCTTRESDSSPDSDRSKALPTDAFLCDRCMKSLLFHDGSAESGGARGSGGFAETVSLRLTSSHLRCDLGPCASLLLQQRGVRKAAARCCELRTSANGGDRWLPTAEMPTSCELNAWPAWRGVAAEGVEVVKNVLLCGSKRGGGRGPQRRV